MIIPTWSQFRAAFNPGGPIDPKDGLTEWPAANVDQPGFVGTISFADPPVFPWFIEVDPGPDAVPGVDMFDWYLSQRSDEPARQYFELQRHDAGGGVTNSGKVRLVLTALATGNHPMLTPQQTVRAYLVLFKNLDLYVYRRSDGLIQHRLLEDVVFTP